MRKQIGLAALAFLFTLASTYAQTPPYFIYIANKGPYGGALGFSAGGHLALMLGLTTPDDSEVVALHGWRGGTTAKLATA